MNDYEYYEFLSHKRSDKFKWFLTTIAILLLAVFLTAACTQGFTNFNPWGWLNSGEEQTEEIEDEANGGMILPEEVAGKGISIVRTAIPVAQYDDYGIMPLAESAYTLTATITPADADNKAVDWSVAWKSPSSSWASGKTVTSYVKVTPTSDGSLTATVQCLQAFGEQVIVTVTSRDNTSVNATVTADYCERVTVTSLTLNGGGGDYAVNGVVQLPYDISLTPKAAVSSSAYTIKSDITTKIEIDFTSEFRTALSKIDGDFPAIFSDVELFSSCNDGISLNEYLDTVSSAIFSYAGDTWYFSEMLSFIKNQYTGNVFEFKVIVTNNTVGDTSTFSFSAPVDKSSMIVRAGKITLDKESIEF